MSNPRSNKLMNTLFGISCVMGIIGALFKIQHYPYGNLMFTLGIISYLVFSVAEIQRLRQIIKDNEYR
jgi:hypothetical protein